MNEIVTTKPPENAVKATGRVVFRVTPKQAYLVNEMVSELQKRNRAHDRTSAFLWLVENWKAIEIAQSALELFNLSEKNELAARALIHHWDKGIKAEEGE